MWYSCMSYVILTAHQNSSVYVMLSCSLLMSWVFGNATWNRRNSCDIRADHRWYSCRSCVKIPSIGDIAHQYQVLEIFLARLIVCTNITHDTHEHEYHMCSARISRRAIGIEDIPASHKWYSCITRDVRAEHMWYSYSCISCVIFMRTMSCLSGYGQKSPMKETIFCKRDL